MAKAPRVPEPICLMCGGKGLINVPVSKAKAVVTMNGGLDFQRTLNYVPTDVYGVRQCPKCDGRGGDRKQRPQKEPSPFLPGCEPNGVAD